MKPRSLKAFSSILAAAIVAMVPLISHAESSYKTGAGTLTATASLDFSVMVERFLYLRVGSGTPLADNPNVSLVVFNVPNASNGNSTPITGSMTVDAQVRGNGGNVSFSNTTPGSMTNGADSLSYTELSATAATLAGSATLLAHPAFVNGGSSSVATLTATSNVVDAGATWTFKYANTGVLTSGTFGGSVPKKGRVTYTAVML